MQSIIRLLADDPLGAHREHGGDKPAPEYKAAFDAISADSNQFLAVAEDAGEIVGTLQLSFIAGLSRRGSWRAQIEAVRIAASRRSEGIGESLLRWAIGRSRERGCKLVQLTTDRERLDAHRFYERLGFEPTHIGYKLML